MSSGVRMTDRELEWWNAHAHGEYTCTDCGRRDSYSYVQPQNPAYYRAEAARGEPIPEALCGACLGARNARLCEARKASFAALPRCEVPGCTRRSTFTVGYPGQTAELCGIHKSRAVQAAESDALGYGPLACLALFGAGPRPTRAGLLALASRRPAARRNGGG